MSKARAGEVRGLFTALITPFDHSGRVDLEQLAKLVRFQTSKGVNGVFPCGSTGLGPMLTLEERKQVARTVVEAAKGRATVVVQVGSADTPSTVELAKQAEDAGAYAVASLTPYYYRQGERATLNHFEAVSKAVGIPVLAYNIPHFTGNDLTPALVSRLAKAGIAGIKDSSRDFLKLLSLLSVVPDGFAVMNGVEEYGLFAIESGADGLVSGGASAIPEPFVSMLTAHRDGERAAAHSAQRKVQQAKRLLNPSPIAAYYEVLRARGIDCGVPRLPFLPLTKAEGAKTISGLKRLGLF